MVLVDELLRAGDAAHDGASCVDLLLHGLLTSIQLAVGSQLHEETHSTHGNAKTVSPGSTAIQALRLGQEVTGSAITVQGIDKNQQGDTRRMPQPEPVGGWQHAFDTLLVNACS